MLQETELEKTPLTIQLDALTKQIIVIAMVALAVSIVVGWVRGQTLDVLFLTAVAFAIAAIPDRSASGRHLPVGDRHHHVRRGERHRQAAAIGGDAGCHVGHQLRQDRHAHAEPDDRGRDVAGRPAPDGLGRGLRPPRARLPTSVAWQRWTLNPTCCRWRWHQAAVARDGGLVGDPTEGALVVLAAKGGIDAAETRKEFPRVAEVPFDAAYKLMATFHEMTDTDGRKVIRCFVKGAPDQLLARAANALTAESKLESVDSVRDRFLAYNTWLGEKELRVMGLARRDFPSDTFDRSAPDLYSLTSGSDLTLLALVGVVDPPRPEARAANAEAHAAGIQVRMITGDHAVTAGAIAGQLGIRGKAITGAEFGAMSDEEAGKQINDIGVIARVTPEHKVRLIEVLERARHVTSITGDGVNDAPAPKKADIGVAMGITGSDVSKEAAVMILTDDNFATIVKAVELGRALYESLVKYIRFQMARLFSFIRVFLGASLFCIVSGIPFLPLQTLYINFTIDLFLAIGIWPRGGRAWVDAASTAGGRR